MSEVEVEVGWLSPQGDGVVRLAVESRGLQNALPGERVRLPRAKGATGFARLTDSPDRVDPGCDRFGECGGCTVRHASPSLQDAARLDLLRRAMRELFPAQDVRYYPSPLREGWRVRARMQWSADGGRTRLGFFARGSHRVVDLPSCPVLAPALEAALPRLREGLGAIASRGEVALAQGASGAVVSLRPATQPDARGYLAAEAMLDATITGVALHPPGAVGATSFGDPRAAVLGGDGGALWTAPDAFSQANAGVNALLAAEVVAQAGAEGRELFEFHAGAGNLTVALARSAKRVTALESDPAAVAALRENVAARGLRNVVVREGSDDSIVGPLKADVVVLDPPRTGARAVAEMLAKHPVRAVVYVSCDPATMARDVALLRGAYEVRSAAGFEMFPQTLHVESVLRLERRGGVLRSGR